MSGLRTILIGFGQIAQGLGRDQKMSAWFDYATHAQVLRDHPAFDWCGVVDPDPKAQEAARGRWRIPHVGTNLTDVAEQVKPEIAVITTPPGGRAAVLNGLPDLKAVLAEKPLNGPQDQAQHSDGHQLVEACATRSLPLAVNYWRRGDETFQRLGQSRLTEEVGTPQAAFATYGNGLHNNGGHMVDFIRLLLGDVTAVQALGPAAPCPEAPLAADLRLAFALTLESGLNVSVMPLDFRCYREVGLDIWGTKGRLSLFQESLDTAIYPRTGNRALDGAFEVASDAPTRLASTAGTALYEIYDNLAAAVRGEAALFSDGRSALRNEAIIAAALTSAQENGQRIEIPGYGTRGNGPA